MTYENSNSASPMDVDPIVVTDPETEKFGVSIPSWLAGKRKVSFTEQFTSKAVELFWGNLEYLASEKAMSKKNRPRQITVFVSSPGGLVDDGCYLIDYMDRIKKLTQEPIEIIVGPCAASMGSLLSQTASPGHLFMHYGRLNSSMNMVHALSYGRPSGKRDGHSRQLGSSLFRMSDFYALYVRRIYMTQVAFRGREPGNNLKAEIQEWLLRQMEAKDTFMDAIQAFNNGLCDFIDIDEMLTREYRRALQWRDGFLKEVAKPDGPNGGVKTSLEEQKTRVKLESKERIRATDYVISLQQQAYQLAEELHRQKKDNPTVRALSALDGLRQQEGEGPNGSIGAPHADPITEAMKAFKAHQEKYGDGWLNLPPQEEW